jgi:uncharacterized glyoxalase superfamily protein PhnB
MHMRFPEAVPEVPVSDLTTALEYYEHHLGFRVDWGGGEGGIAGVSSGRCRLFLTDRGFREHRGNRGPIVIWLNFGSKDEVDAQFERWRASGATVVSSPESKPWMLHEFTVADVDGNLFRVFYDFSREA